MKDKPVDSIQPPVEMVTLPKADIEQTLTNLTETMEIANKAIADSKEHLEMALASEKKAKSAYEFAINEENKFEAVKQILSAVLIAWGVSIAILVTIILVK